MDSFSLVVQSRPDATKARRLRRESQIPAVFYGKGMDTLHLMMDGRHFTKLYKAAGESSLIDLDVDGKQKFKTLIHAVQFHPVTDEVIHVDFVNVKMDQKLTTHIPVELTGTAPAVKDFAGIVSLQSQEVEIRCLPSDLIHNIQVDVSELRTLHDSIRAKDLKVPSTIEILTDPERTIVTVLAPKKEEETVTTVSALETAKAEEAAAAAAAGTAEGGDKKSEPEKKEEKK